MPPFCNTTRNTHQKFLFVGNRLEVLQAMLESCEYLTIYMQSQTYASRAIQNRLSTKHKKHYYEFSSKAELLALLQSLEFKSHIKFLLTATFPYCQISMATTPLMELFCFISQVGQLAI